MLELLSPAGSPEAVIAAVQNGADAVYMGLDGFNARRGAKNFSVTEFAKAVRYCHIRGCKVYVTLNTLVSDKEMEELVELARVASDTGADAILVQDSSLFTLNSSLLISSITSRNSNVIHLPSSIFLLTSCRSCRCRSS